MESQNPKVSVIVPCYNSETYVQDALKSILSQDFKDFEIIIVDDASTDKSLDKMAEIAKKDKRVIILKNKTNKGRAGSVNEGFKRARGEFITFSDADDLFYPERLKKQVAFMQKNPNIDMIYGDMIKFWENGKEKLRKAVKFKNTAEPLQRLKKESKTKKNYVGAFAILDSKDYIPGTSIFFRRKIIDSGLKMDKSMWYEDCDFNFQIIGAGYKIARIPIVTFKYRIHADQKTSVQSKVAKATNMIVKKLRSGKYFK